VIVKYCFNLQQQKPTQGQKMQAEVQKAKNDGNRSSTLRNFCLFSQFSLWSAIKTKIQAYYKNCQLPKQINYTLRHMTVE